MTAEAEAAATPPGLPEGFALSDRRRGGFSTHNGPWYEPVDRSDVRRAFYAVERHCNGYGIVHGGLLTAFLDAQLGQVIGRTARVGAVTVHLSVDFLSVGRKGEWIIGDSKLTRLTRDLAFAEGRAVSGTREIARATGVFKLMRSRGDGE